MQNSNPSRNPFSPSLLQELLERTLFGARPAPGDAPAPGDIPAADTAPGDDLADDESGLDDLADAGDAGDPGDEARQLELAELLGVLRDPIAWVFTRAERHAHGDPIDIAAIHRVRDAVVHRVNSIVDGVPADDASARIRSADLLTIGSHLIGTLDPGFVQRVLQSVGTHIADVFTAGLQADPALADLARAAAPFPGPERVPSPLPPWYVGAPPTRPVAPCGCGATMPHPFAPYGGHYGGPLAGLHALRPVVPPWSWHSFPFAY